MEFMEMERQLQDNVTKRLQAILEPEDLLFDEPMKDYTTFRVGGPAKWMAAPQDEQQLRVILKICRELQIPCFILGRGSNLLVSDKGFDGVIVNLRKHFNKIEVDRENKTITAEAGASLPAVSQAALSAGLTGLEFAAGIPGTMGGGLFMNAGAYGGELKQVVTEAAVMTKDGMILHVPAEQMTLGHRLSSFMQTGEIILSVKMQLTQGNPVVIKETMDDFNSRGREKQPLEYPSAGSTFKRPAGYFAGKLIEDAGLKGFSVGGAQVSKKHAGFVINTGSATAADIWNLCTYFPGGRDAQIYEDFLYYYIMNPAPNTIALFLYTNGLDYVEEKTKLAVDELDRTAAECGVFAHDVMICGSSLGAYPAMHAAIYCKEDFGITVPCVLSLDAGSDWQETEYTLSREECLKTAQLGTQFYLFESPLVGMDRAPIREMVLTGNDVTIVGCVYDQHERISFDALGMGVIDWALGDRSEPYMSDIYSFNRLAP